LVNPHDLSRPWGGGNADWQKKKGTFLGKKSNWMKISGGKSPKRLKVHYGGGGGKKRVKKDSLVRGRDDIWGRSLKIPDWFKNLRTNKEKKKVQKRKTK